MTDPDERIHPLEPFDWHQPVLPPVGVCGCLLCLPHCEKMAVPGARYCMPCFQGYHHWRDAPCGSPFHGHPEAGDCDCTDPRHRRRP